MLAPPGPNDTARDNYPAVTEETARLAKAIGHPARITILKFLASQESCFCGQIVDQVPLAQSTVSQHLRALSDAGLIKGTVDGVKVCYCLNPDIIAHTQTLVGGFLNDLANAAKFHDANCSTKTPGNRLGR